jgi:hypothetical protein
VATAMDIRPALTIIALTAATWLAILAVVLLHR